MKQLWYLKKKKIVSAWNADRFFQHNREQVIVNIFLAMLRMLCIQNPHHIRNAFLVPAWVEVSHSIGYFFTLFVVEKIFSLILWCFCHQLSYRYQVNTVYRYYTIMASAIQHSDSMQHKFTYTLQHAPKGSSYYFFAFHRVELPRIF